MTDHDLARPAPPERFQVGGTVSIRDAVWIGEGGFVSRPTPSALDPFAWDLEQLLWPADGPGPLLDCEQYPFPAWVAWSRFCYWAAGQMTDHDLTRTAPWEQIDGLDFEDRYGGLRLLLLVGVVPVLIVALVFAVVWWAP